MTIFAGKTCERFQFRELVVSMGRGSVNFERESFGYLKKSGFFRADYLEVRGAVKVMCHLIFGILALTADQLMKLIA